MALDKRNLIVRSLSGLIYIGLTIGAILWNEIGVALLCSLFAVIAIYELERMAEGKFELKWKTFYCVDCLIALFGIWGVAAASLVDIDSGLPYALLTIAFLLVGLRVVMQIFIREKNGLVSVAISTFSVVYICIPLACFVLLEQFFMMVRQPWMLVAAISMIWINDTGAYLVGCTIGRHRLYEALSPKKSWEGFFGGLLFNIGAGIGYYFIFNRLNWSFPIEKWIFLGIGVTVAATLGDLFESMIKRNMEVKDSGKLIPGHGGILDRIDSLLFVLPFLFFYMIP